MSMPQWLTPPVPAYKGTIRRHRSVMHDEFAQQQYIRLKQEWLDEHPGATAEECLRAFRRLADRCGI